MSLQRRIALSVAMILTVSGLAAVASAADPDEVGDIGTLAGFGNGIYGSALDADGNLYVADLPGHRVWMVTPDGTATVFAGTGVSGFSGDGGPATSAQLSAPTDVAIDSDGNLYIGDRDNHRVRIVDPTGEINTFAGTGGTGSTGDSGAATSAEIGDPTSVTVDGNDNVYIGDSDNGEIRKVVPAGTITTLATVTNYHLDADADGNVYASDISGAKVRKVDPSGTVTTFAGTGVEAYAGDGGLATAAQLNRPGAVAVDSEGNVYIATVNDHRVRKVDIDTLVIETIAGTGTSGYTGDGGPATSATFNGPTGVTVNAGGDVFITDYYNSAVRYIANADGDADGFPDLVDTFPDVFSECRGRQATIIGTSGADLSLNGTSGEDIIMGFGGGDTIDAGAGDDLVCAGGGSDTVSGGDGKDKIYGEDGADTLNGNEMSDHLYGGNGTDTLRGNGGTRDRLFGGDGVDDLNAGTGTDDRCTTGETYANCEVVF